MSLVDHNRHHPRCDAGFLDLGSRLRRCTCHAALTLATDMKMCLRLVLVLHGGRGTNENTGGLNLWVPAQRHPDHHTPALPQAPSPKSLGGRPRAALGWPNSTRSIRTPTRCFHHLTPRLSSHRLVDSAPMLRHTCCIPSRETAETGASDRPRYQTAGDLLSWFLTGGFSVESTCGYCFDNFCNCCSCYIVLGGAHSESRAWELFSEFISSNKR